jgi:beta-N-acetylhexosaminidase
MPRLITFSCPPYNAIIGCASSKLSVAKKALFKQVRPLGLILFARNIATPKQVSALVDEFKSITDNVFT